MSSASPAGGIMTKSLRRIAGRRAPLWVAPLALMALAVGCSNTGSTYPLDVFPEMHYTSSFRMQEPPRRPAVKDSVPITGKEVPLDPANLKTAQGPLRSAVNKERAAKLFATNCAACHGPKGEGNGPVADYFKRDGASNLPANLTAATRTVNTDGEIFQTITAGRGLMPAFRTLLTEDERWIIAEYVKDFRP